MLNLGSNGVQGSTLLFRRRTILLPHSASTVSIASDLYLVNNPARSRGAASTPTLTKVPVCRSSEKKNNPNSTIDFLKEIGLDDSHVEMILKSHPRLLRCKVEKTLIPKIRVLEDLGICGSELISVIASYPSFLTNSSKENLLAKLDFLKSILGSVENARNAVKKVKWLLYASLTNTLQPNFELLKSYGISDERLQKLLVKYPRYLCCNPKWLQESLVRVEQVLGIPRESGMFHHGLKVIVSLSKKTLQLKFEMFKRYGWSESDVVVMVKRSPYCLLISEAKLKTGMDFFVSKLGYEISYLAARPSLLLFSMEERILPRYAVLQVLQERKLMTRNHSIYTVMSLSESEFLDAYVLPFKDNLPELYEAYAGGQELKFDCIIVTNVFACLWNCWIWGPVVLAGYRHRVLFFYKSHCIIVDLVDDYVFKVVPMYIYAFGLISGLDFGINMKLCSFCDGAVEDVEVENGALVDSNVKVVSDASNSVVAGQVTEDRLLKYTFQRKKRKKPSLSMDNDDARHEVNSLRRRIANKIKFDA
ncbi:hypothetical protein Dimus_023868 [Dionaea muscipula]